MNITKKQFATKAGLIVEYNPLDQGYGGKWSYKVKGSENVSFSGHRTEVEAINAWFRDTFGDACAAALMQVFKPMKQKRV